MGGPLMAAAGAEILFDPTAESTIGFGKQRKNLGFPTSIIRVYPLPTGKPTGRGGLG